MEEQDAEALKLREYWKQVMEDYTSDSSKLHEYLKENMTDFPAGDGELQIFKFRYGRNWTTLKFWIIEQLRFSWFCCLFQTQSYP